MNKELVRKLRIADIESSWTGKDGLMWLAANEIESLYHELKTTKELLEKEDKP